MPRRHEALAAPRCGGAWAAPVAVEVVGRGEVVRVGDVPVGFVAVRLVGVDVVPVGVDDAELVTGADRALAPGRK